MYSWIWRTLPGGRPGKALGSLALFGAVVALLFTVVFPAVEPLLPYSDVTVVEAPDELEPEPSPAP